MIIKATDLEEKIGTLFLSDEQLQKILHKAVSDTARWSQRKVATVISNATKISVRIIRSRMRLDIKSAQYGHSRIWVGLNPIKLHRLKPRQTRTGVKAGKINIPGAFIVEKRQVFKRRGPARLSICLQEIDIREEALAALKQITSEISAQLQESFEQAYSKIAS